MDQPTTSSFIRAAETLQELCSIRLCMADDVPKYSDLIIARKHYKELLTVIKNNERIEAPSIGQGGTTTAKCIECNTQRIELTMLNNSRR